MSSQKIDKHNFKHFILILGDTFGKELTKARVQAYELILFEKLEGLFFNSLIEQIAKKFEYFPTPKQILDFISPQLTLKDHAETLVDRFVAYLEGRLSREQISTSDLNYCQKRFQADKFSFGQGKINLSFQRREWVAKAERDFEFGINEQLAIESPRALKLIQDTNKQLE